MKKNDEATKKSVCLGLLTHPLLLFSNLKQPEKEKKPEESLLFQTLSDSTLKSELNLN